MADLEDHTVVIHVVPGQVLDQRWRIDTRIGQGAMGSVFRGRDLRANRVVAIKILAPEHCRKPKVLARFEREAETMTELRHPNLVQLYGHGRHGLLPYIVMELLDGLTLAQVLERNGGTLGLAETVAIVKQVAAGLSFLHHHSLVHRDVKPQNIVIGAGGRVTILDLGVVRDQHNPGLTRPGAMVGTPYYMSPEQIYGVDDIDRRTDVYALAAMTFELLAGRPPFLGNNNFEVLYGHKNLPAPDASQLVKTVTKVVAQVLSRGMSKRRDERPDTVSEFIADLEAAAGAKKVNLGKVYAQVAPKSVADERTRVVRRLKAKADDEVPMADSEDVDSLGGNSAQNAVGADEQSQPSGDDSKTQLLNIERTFVGQTPRSRSRSRSRETSTSTVPLLAVRTGELKISATARGRELRAPVEVDGAVCGTTPCVLSLSEGKHAVRVALSGYRAVEKHVEISSEQRAVLKLALES